MKIHYLTGSRADFGLMHRCLDRLHKSDDHELGVVMTGQHTIANYGRTDEMIHASGLPVVCEIPVRLTGSSGSEMALALAEELAGLTEFWQADRPDFVLLLGDRGEMLAGALAAVHLGIHTGHIHGGERSGTLDESFRHAISKLSHLHFPATEEARQRLISMGEQPERITVIGAPGLVGVPGQTRADAGALRARFDLPPTGRLAVCIFHPVVQEAAQAAEQVAIVIAAARAEGYALLVVRPNSDAGGQAIEAYLNTLAGAPDLRVVTHLERNDYLGTMASCDLVIGNSSSGIIESASFGVPCVNIGSRQNDRQRNDNTFDCPEVSDAPIRAAIRKAQCWPRSRENVYGDGRADEYLVTALSNLHLSPDLLVKRNGY